MQLGPNTQRVLDNLNASRGFSLPPFLKRLINTVFSFGTQALLGNTMGPYAITDPFYQLVASKLTTELESWLSKQQTSASDKITFDQFKSLIQEIKTYDESHPRTANNDINFPDFVDWLKQNNKMDILLSLFKLGADKECNIETFEGMRRDSLQWLAARAINKELHGTNSLQWLAKAIHKRSHTDLACLTENAKEIVQAHKRFRAMAKTD